MRKILISAVCPILMLMGTTSNAVEETPSRVKESFPKLRKAQNLEEEKVSVGVNAGSALTEGRANTLGYGVEAAFQPVIPLSAVLELGGYVAPASGTTPVLTRTKLLARGQYNLGGDIPFVRYSWVGVGIGPVWDNMNNSTVISLGVAPIVGFDIPINEDAKFSLGANANYMFVGNAKPDVFALNGVAKYWF